MPSSYSSSGEVTSAAEKTVYGPADGGAGFGAGSAAVSDVPDGGTVSRSGAATGAGAGAGAADGAGVCRQASEFFTP